MSEDIDSSSIFLRPRTARKVLKPENFEILELLKDSSPMSIESIAEALERDETGLEQSLKMLFEAALIDTQGDGDITEFSFNFDDVTIIFGDIKEHPDFEFLQYNSQENSVDKSQNSGDATE